MSLLLVQVLATLRHIVRVEQVRGEVLVVDGRRLIPVTRVVRIRGFGRHGGWGFIRNRPVAVLEELGEGIYRNYRIPDVTWRTVAIIMISALVLRALLALLFPRRVE
jgi:uncharacterized spore protein YtfJ